MEKFKGFEVPDLDVLITQGDYCSHKGNYCIGIHCRDCLFNDEIDGSAEAFKEWLATKNKEANK